MDIQETRRLVLRELIKTRNNGIVRQFAAEIGKPDGQINDMLATPPRKSFGERVARQIESLAKVAHGFLDDPDNAGQSQATTQIAAEPASPTYAASRLSAEGFAFGRFYEMLEPEKRAEFRAAIVKTILEDRIANPGKFAGSFGEIIDLLQIK